MEMNALWFQNYYKLRKKVLALTNKYWIEDESGRVLGFSKQRMFKLEEDIRVYDGEEMKNEIFRIQQTQIMDIWGTFVVIDSKRNETLGHIKRKIKILEKASISLVGWDIWSIYDRDGNMVGEIEESEKRGLVRRYAPGGSLVPERMTLKLNGRPVVEINQKLRIIGDLWEVKVMDLPDNFDRRVLLGGALLMAMIERKIR